MQQHSCSCKKAEKVRRPVFRRILHFIRWAMPGVGLALIPKCPVCLAAYIAVGTGLGIPITTARYLRWGLIALCVSAIIYLAIRQLSAFRRRRLL
ncbi:hypothetical protein SAMN05444266_103344 [Chitinophaga jiangningensis]|uniref:Uncharacterized protein n=1 Tax=Chitinophaga jiangningensis TaxID=1419482 RepID=A0A1M7AMU3_9BACT|nr:hypothetical protein [Chitinophaga jiangningensis]SHL43957.1 hypothetical protein SAMN05444266_103344 [Chitinophaga jiangningensis]